jgi:hypothetical protein
VADVIWACTEIVSVYHSSLLKTVEQAKKTEELSGQSKKYHVANRTLLTLLAWKEIVANPQGS